MAGWPIQMSDGHGVGASSPLHLLFLLGTQPARGATCGAGAALVLSIYYVLGAPHKLQEFSRISGKGRSPSYRWRKKLREAN